MTDIHATLEAETRTQFTIERDTAEIRDKLGEIRYWYPQLADTMFTISGYSMDLTGIPSTTETPLPGGDALAMLGPYSTGYTEPDDLPHPAQVIREWANRWREATRAPEPVAAKWSAHLAILEANTGWFIRQDRAGEFRSDIRAVHARLQHLTGDAEPKPEPEPDDITQMGHLIPDDVMLTRDEAEHFWPHALDNRAWGNLREKARYHRERGMDIPSRKYPVQWIRDAIASDLTSA